LNNELQEQTHSPPIKKQLPKAVTAEQVQTEYVDNTHPKQKLVVNVLPILVLSISESRLL